MFGSKKSCFKYLGTTLNSVVDRASVGDFHTGELTTEYGIQHSVQSAAAAAPEAQIFNSPSVPDGS